MATVSQGLIDLLSTLDEDSLFALARTVTQGLKRCSTVEEAIDTIIKYSPGEISILRRKVVTREILFNYLEANNIRVKLPVTKNDLIDALVEAWNLPCTSSQGSTFSSDSDGTVAILTEKSQKEESNVNVMAEQFAKWFYSMLNDDECGIEHFFPDANLFLNVFTNNDCESTQIAGDAGKITNTLLMLKSQNKLHFNPNDSQDGIQGRMDPHGLVMVLTCGTVHAQNTCAGVFEQVFALARDPFSDNNWKIKTTALNLRSKTDVLEAPKLCDSELTSDLLMLPLE